MAVKALSSGSRSLMRSNAASMTRVAFTLPFVTAAAISAAPLHMSVSAGVLSMKDRRRLGVVGQLERIDARCVAEHQAEIELNAVAPCRIDVQTERLRCGTYHSIDEILCRSSVHGA